MIVICMLLQLPALAQKGTEFRKLTFEEALAAAKEEGKMVFVDCYTTWCGPCKMMTEKVFPLKEVGDYLNGKFVCVKFDMEKGEGKELAAKYYVNSYPTFLVLTADGRQAHRLVGAVLDGGEFVRKVEDGLNENSIANLERRYAAGERGTEFVVGYVAALKGAGETARAREVATDFLNLLTDGERTSAACWPIYEDAELSPAGSGNALYLLRRVAQFREGVGAEKVNARVASMLETQVEDILRGRNRDASAENVGAIEKLLDVYGLQDYGRLSACVALAKAMLAGDSAAALTACREAFVGMSDEKLSYLYFYPLTALKGKWTAEQKEELEKLTAELVAGARDEVLKSSLDGFAKGMLPNL